MTAPEPVSPNAVVTVSLLRAVGVQSVHDARALLREALVWQIPKLSGANITEVLAAFTDNSATVPGQRHTEHFEPGEVRRGQGARYGGVDETGDLHDGPEDIE